MKVTTFKCDGCGVKLSEEDESRQRYFELRTPFASAELDICRDCWDKMCAAVGKKWLNSAGGLVSLKQDGKLVPSTPAHQHPRMTDAP